MNINQTLKINKALFIQLTKKFKLISLKQKVPQLRTDKIPTP